MGTSANLKSLERFIVNAALAEKRQMLTSHPGLIL
jgi:hypothetical protein